MFKYLMDEYLKRHPLPAGLERQMKSYEQRMLMPNYEGGCPYCGSKPATIVVVKDPTVSPDSKLGKLRLACKSCVNSYW